MDRRFYAIPNDVEDIRQLLLVRRRHAKDVSAELRGQLPLEVGVWGLREVLAGGAWCVASGFVCIPSFGHPLLLLPGRCVAATARPAAAGFGAPAAAWAGAAGLLSRRQAPL